MSVKYYTVCHADHIKDGVSSLCSDTGVVGWTASSFAMWQRWCRPLWGA